MNGGRSGKVLVVALLVIAALSGCTRSLEMTYTPSLYRLPQADKLKGIVLGVGKLEDRRSWVDRTEPKTRAYFMQQSPWRFGLTYKEQEFVPVADLVQILLVDEFGRAGIETKRIPLELTKDNVSAMQTAGQQNGVGYALGGRVLVFEVVNETGFATVTSRRSVTLEIHLLQVRSGNVVFDSIVSHSDRRGEGMGVLHTTNVDRLMNTVFRQVVTQVVEQVAAKLALHPRDVNVRIVMIEG